MVRRTTKKPRKGTQPATPPPPADPYAPDKLAEELKGLLSVIPRYEPGRLPRYVDEKETKIFAINLARILSHHGLSGEKAANRYRGMGR